MMACAITVGLTGAAYAQSTSELDEAYAVSDLLPPEAKPGECYARVYIPAVEKEVARQVLIKEATEELTVIEAEYKTVVETIEIAKEAERLELIPAVFKTETTTVELEPEKEVEEIIPAVYEEVVEKVKIREAYKTWKKGEGPIQKYDEATGEIMCLVEIPAEYNEVTKRVIKSPPRTITKVIPAQMRTMDVKVMVEPPKTKTVAIPAQFEEVEVRKLVTPAKIERIEIPARYETVYENPLQHERFRRHYFTPANRSARQGLQCWHDRRRSWRWYDECCEALSERQRACGRSDHHRDPQTA